MWNILRDINYEGQVDAEARIISTALLFHVHGKTNDAVSHQLRKCSSSCPL